jgi:hypothetical protein
MSELPKLSNEQYIKEIITQIFKRLHRRWRMLIMLPIVVFGLVYLVLWAFFPEKYVAEYIIAAEEEGTQAIEGIMAQYGIDIEGGVKTSSVFKGESLVQLFLTRSMVERALREPIEIDGERKSAVAWFFPYTKHARKRMFQDVEFSSTATSSISDSAVFLTYKYLLKEVLDVGRPEKRMSFIHVSTVHQNPRLAAAFSDLLIRTVTDYYIETVTKKARLNVDVLQEEFDSIQALLEQSIYAAAQETDRNIRSVRAGLMVDQKRAIIDLEVRKAMFSEVAKNLKLAEITLRKKTPMIQLVQGAHFPLERAQMPHWKLAAFGGMVALAIALYFSFYGFVFPRMDRDG